MDLIVLMKHIYSITWYYNFDKNLYFTMFNLYPTNNYINI